MKITPNIPAKYLKDLKPGDKIFVKIEQRKNLFYYHFKIKLFEGTYVTIKNIDIDQQIMTNEIGESCHPDRFELLDYPFFRHED